MFRLHEITFNDPSMADQNGWYWEKINAVDEEVRVDRLVGPFKTEDDAAEAAARLGIKSHDQTKTRIRTMENDHRKRSRNCALLVRGLLRRSIRRVLFRRTPAGTLRG